MSKKRKIAVIGLGYVGLTTAIAFSQLGKVIAFDISTARVDELKAGHDKNEEVSDKELKGADAYYTSDPQDLKEADFYVVSVPTPLDNTRHPDLSMLLNATTIVGQQLKKGDIVVFESTVYPGATEEQCVPLLEAVSGLKYEEDFAVGYSPERINPSDKEHTFYNVIKIVSATNPETLNIVAEIYKSVVKAGVFPVSSIRVAEAVKVIENIQRDINIAFMNEIAMILHSLDIETTEVIAGMKTKWNFIPFQPGLVGGHCIGVNSYYLMHKMDESGYRADIMMAARRVNESIVKFIVDETIKMLIKLKIDVNKARIAVLGITYKKDCPDFRDSKVVDIVKELQTYNLEVIVHDPIANPIAVKKEYGIFLNEWDDIGEVDVIFLAVGHQFYLDMDKKLFIEKFNRPALIIDIKEIFDPKEFQDSDITLWRL